MQYPMRDVDCMRDMFKGHEGITFISNEKNFKQALRGGDMVNTLPACSQVISDTARLRDIMIAET